MVPIMSRDGKQSYAAMNKQVPQEGWEYSGMISRTVNNKKMEEL